MFFEMMDCEVHFHDSRVSGNPVRIGDGCATVTGLQLLGRAKICPQPLVY